MAYRFEFQNQSVEGIIEQFATQVPRETRSWSSMVDYFQEAPSGGTDPVIYDLFSLPYGDSHAELMTVLTVLYGGRIGKERFHTKGHFHTQPDGPEYVIVLAGRGILERGQRDGTIEESIMAPDTHIMVPPGQAHRAVNVTDEPLLFVSLCSAAVGHDYASVATLGWATPKNR